MDESCAKLTSAVAYEILAYLVHNPDAQDTVEGIIEWWLLQQRIVRGEIVIKEALAELMHKELLIERKRKYSRPRYRINREKIKDIQALLKHRRLYNLNQHSLG